MPRLLLRCRASQPYDDGDDWLVEQSDRKGYHALVEQRDRSTRKGLVGPRGSFKPFNHRLKGWQAVTLSDQSKSSHTESALILKPDSDVVMTISWYSPSRGIQENDRDTIDRDMSISLIQFKPQYSFCCHWFLHTKKIQLILSIEFNNMAAPVEIAASKDFT